MIDEAHLKGLKLWEHPLGQRTIGHILTLSYFTPPRTRIEIEGLENIPSNRTIIFALNHTDMYNYWPLQWKMWRLGHLPFTTTWVKGKYYENRALRFFFDNTNNIPLSSRGYLILQDARALLGRKLQDEEYRNLRDLVDGKCSQSEVAAGASTDMQRLLGEARQGFDPDQETYAEFMDRWNNRLMGLVERRSLEALFERHNNLIVFPQGTRSKRLLPGKPGLAQFALRHEVPVVPVGSMGSEQAYPGASPWASGADVHYRIGKPMSVDDAFADCRIEKPYVPFTREADRYRDHFALATARITEAIDELLDEPYRMASADDQDARTRADRLT